MGLALDELYFHYGSCLLKHTMYVHSQANMVP